MAARPDLAHTDRAPASVHTGCADGARNQPGPVPCPIATLSPMSSPATPMAAIRWPSCSTRKAWIPRRCSASRASSILRDQLRAAGARSGAHGRSADLHARSGSAFRQASQCRHGGGAGARAGGIGTSRAGRVRVRRGGRTGADRAAARRGGRERRRVAGAAAAVPARPGARGCGGAGLAPGAGTSRRPSTRRKSCRSA